MSAAGVLDADTGNSFSTAIDAGVSELCWVDVEVTYDVCSGVHRRHDESRWDVTDKVVAVVDAVVSTFSDTTSRHARAVVHVPLYEGTADITAALKRHR